MKITHFKQLRDLMIADQTKRKVWPEVKEHFIDIWSSIVDPQVLISKLDDCELVRRSLKKLATPKSNLKGKIHERNKFAKNAKVETERQEFRSNRRDEGDTSKRLNFW